MTAPQPGPGYVRIGDGVHSTVYRRPGSRRVLQLFKPDCPELTPAKIHHEYAYLQRIYSPTLPRLIPRQRLVQPHPGGELDTAVLVQDYVPHDPAQPLTWLEADTLSPNALTQLRAFLRITRGLLAASPQSEYGQAPMLPDIIDPPMANLVVHSLTGDLTLLDTNRLISTRKLLRLRAAGYALDVDQHPIHALLLRRMLFLEARYLNRTQGELADDPVYTAYLDTAGFTAVFHASAAAGEPIPR